jgi:type IV fimbrial biogenesis protein FimT
MMQYQRSRCEGFTLIELLVVLTLLVVLQTLAVPAMSAVADSIRVQSVTQSFFSNLQFTRSEAIKRNARVVLCKSDTGLRCVRTGGWEQGWIVFQDVNNNAQVDAGEPVLQRELALVGALRLTGNTQVESYISYTPLGHTSTTSGAFQAGTFTVCRRSTTQTEARQIVISSAGRVRTQKVTLNQCA